MTNNTAQKLDSDVIEFLDRFRVNRIKQDMETKYISYNRLIKIMVNYFKLNNDEYINLVKLMENKNA